MTDRLESFCPGMAASLIPRFYGAFSHVSARDPMCQHDRVAPPHGYFAAGGADVALGASRTTRAVEDQAGGLTDPVIQLYRAVTCAMAPMARRI